MKNDKSTIFLIDFDGTCVTHDFPYIGKDIGAIPVLKKIVKAGHRIILWTMRSDEKESFLTDAVNWFKKNNIPLYGINTNPTQHSWTTSPKAYGQYCIDDINLGTPLIFDITFHPRPFVYWDKIETILIEEGLIDGR